MSREKSEAYAKNLKMKYFDTSAKTGENVNHVFTEFATNLKKKQDLMDEETGGREEVVHKRTKLGGMKNIKKGGCCGD